MSGCRQRRVLVGAGAVALVLGLGACSGGGDDDGPAPAGDGALVATATDVDLGFPQVDTGDDAAVGRSVLDGWALPGADGSLTVVTKDQDGGAPQLLRVPAGAGAPVASAGLEAFGDAGRVRAAALAADGTLVVVGVLPDSSGVVVRVAPDDSAAVVPLTLDGAPVPPALLIDAAVGLSPDGALAVAARAERDPRDPLFTLTGNLEVVGVDTATGAVTSPALVAQRDPVAASPVAPPVAATDVVVAVDGSAAVAVDVLRDGATTSAVQRFDAAGAPVGEPVPLPSTARFEQRQLTAGPDGAVYATGLAPDPDGDQPLDAGWDGALQLLRLPAAGAAGEAEVVAAFPGRSSSYGVAVGPDGRWAYLTGYLSSAGGGAVTPVDLTSGAVAAPVVLCEEGLVTTPVVAADGSGLGLVGACGPRGATTARALLLTTG